MGWFGSVVSKNLLQIQGWKGGNCLEACATCVRASLWEGGGGKRMEHGRRGSLSPASISTSTATLLQRRDREIERQAANQRKGEKGREKKKLFLEEGATTGKKERRREGGGGAKDRNLIKMKPIPFLVRFGCAGLGNGGGARGGWRRHRTRPRGPVVCSHLKPSRQSRQKWRSKQERLFQ